MKKITSLLTAAAAGLCLCLGTSVTAFSEEVTFSESSQNMYDFFLIPDSSSRFIDEFDIYSLSLSDIRIAKNEIYARHGRQFKSQDLQEYFNSMLWYQGDIAPEDFDDNVFNIYETRNVSFLDSCINQNINSGLPSVIPSLIEEYSVSISGIPISVIDEAGLEQFTCGLSVTFCEPDMSWYSEDVHNRVLNKYNHLESTPLGAYYFKDGQLCGNLEPGLAMGYLNSGKPCALINGSLYQEVMLDSRPYDSYNYIDTFELRRDDIPVASASAISTHDSSIRGCVNWLITDDSIYVSNETDICAYDLQGNLKASVEGYRYIIAVDSTSVYILNHANSLYRADKDTFSNTEFISGDIMSISTANAGDLYLFYRTSDSVCHRYFYDTGLSEESFYETSSWDFRFFAAGPFAYASKSNYQTNSVQLSIYNDEQQYFEPYLFFNGLCSIMIDEIHDGVIFLSADTFQGWYFEENGQPRAVNHLSMAYYPDKKELHIINGCFYS